MFGWWSGDWWICGGNVVASGAGAGCGVVGCPVCDVGGDDGVWSVVVIGATCVVSGAGGSWVWWFPDSASPSMVGSVVHPESVYVSINAAHRVVMGRMGRIDTLLGADVG